MAQHSIYWYRVERRFLEIEERLRKHGNGIPQPDKLIPTTTNYIDEKIERYKNALEIAMRNAPCAGCRRLVLGALTGLAIFEAMESSDKKRADISDTEIEIIKKEVEKKYANY